MKNRYNNNDCGCGHHERPCPPQRPETIGNGMNIRVNIKSVNDTPMDDLNFVLKFRVFGCPDEIVLHKQQLYTAYGKYYALLNDKYLAHGWLMCDIEVYEPMPGWPNGMKPASLRCNTGLSIGNCFDVPFPMEHGMMPNAKGYVNGYKVTFTKVDDLPTEEEEDEDEGNEGGNEGNNDNEGGNNNNGGGNNEDNTPKVDVRYGIIRGLSAFNAITDTQIASFTKLTSKPSGITNVNITEGDTLVVLTNGAVVKKDDGIGGKVPFDTSIMGANGESVTVGGTSFSAYGETFIVSGSTGFYVE